MSHKIQIENTKHKVDILEYKRVTCINLLLGVVSVVVVQVRLRSYNTLFQFMWTCLIVRMWHQSILKHCSTNNVNNEWTTYMLNAWQITKIGNFITANIREYLVNIIQLNAIDMLSAHSYTNTLSSTKEMTFTIKFFRLALYVLLLRIVSMSIIKFTWARCRVINWVAIL